MPLGDGTSQTVYDPHSVQERIKQWQSQGGGVIITEDTLSNSKDCTTLIKGQASRRQRGARTPSRRHVREHMESGRVCDDSVPKLDGDVTQGKSRSAPTKRVVSDGHWRKNRTPLKIGISTKVVSDGQVRDDSVEKETSRDMFRELRKVSSRQKVQDIPSSNEITPLSLPKTPSELQMHSEPHHHRKSKEVDSEKENKGDSDIEMAPASPGIIPHRNRTVSRQSTGSNKLHDWKNRRTSGRIQSDIGEINHSVHGPFSEGRSSQRTKKGNILSQVLGESKKIFAGPVEEPSITPSMPSIEQWLEATPDPFIDADEVKIESTQTLKSRESKKRNKPQESKSLVSGSPYDHLDDQHHKDPPPRGSRRKKRERGALGIDDEVPAREPEPGDSRREQPAETMESLSPFTDRTPESSEKQASKLGRRGANRRATSPVKHRTKSSMEVESPIAVVEESANPPSDSVPPLRPPGLNIKKVFPSTGDHRLSTIASVATLETKLEDGEPALEPNIAALPSAIQTMKEREEEELKDSFDTHLPVRKNSRLIKHSDLMSILSQPHPDGRSIRSARSIRTSRSRLATATLPDLMRELATDETTYMRELQTLVDGVIPVLLSCVLSRADSAAAAGLFSSTASPGGDPHYTKPIVDMGIALERLKTLHKRLPHIDHRSFLTWCHGAQRVYLEYLKAWRMGFQDVVVNLAPANDPGTKESANGQERNVLPRNSDGDVVNVSGERVDVAFLLKRPLVRLKYLAKTLKGIDTVQHTTEAQNLASRYQTLVEQARQRADEERSRLEDESAANVDSTRARDFRTLAPVTGISIDRTRRVRARDHFNLSLQHSSGQQVDCRVELIYRDASGDGDKGDLLICEVDATGRWLLLPPVAADLVSARNGDLRNEIIVMIRGIGSSGQEWRELLSLQAEEESVGFEWVQMLGLTPVPPRLTRSHSFLNMRRKTITALADDNYGKEESSRFSAAVVKSRTPSPRDLEIPIGEQAILSSENLEGSSREHDEVTSSVDDPVDSQYNAATAPNVVETSSTTPTRSSQNYVDRVNDLRSLPSQSREAKSKTKEPVLVPRSFKEALGLSGTSNAMGLRRTQAKRISRHGQSSPRSKQSRENSPSPASSPITGQVHDIVAAETSCISRTLDSHLQNNPSPGPPQKDEETRPATSRSHSSTPSRDLPFIPKARKHSPPVSPSSQVDAEPVWSTPPATHLPPTPSKMRWRKKRPSSSPVVQKADGQIKDPAAATSPQLDLTRTPILETSRNRRSSSPLKHEYEPSSASDTELDSEASTVARNEAPTTSDSSEDDLEAEDIPTPLLPLGGMKSFSRAARYQTNRPPTEGSLKPSDSASQAPYKTVPMQPAKSCKTTALIFSWSEESASWDRLHPDECSIVISPGLIEAFEMSAAHSQTKPLSTSVPIADVDKFSDMALELTSQNDTVQGERPLIAMELTPLVPLRKGTAIDITIRSPPTPNSLLEAGNNIMFRSRSIGECEALYALINWARIHNPTYIALQNARPSLGPSVPFGGALDRKDGSKANGKRRSMFRHWGRSSSYRASTKRSSSVAQTESSVGTTGSAFSALWRFNNRKGAFNIAKSTVGSRTGSRANSVYTSSDNSSGSGTSTPAPPGFLDSRNNSPIGLNNAKIRLHLRSTNSRWIDLGPARLTIMRPDSHSVVGPDGRPLSSAGPLWNDEKRIIITNKKGNHILLDEQLGETCFERIAQTGIAISVWQDFQGPNGEIGVVNAHGGVAGGRATIYMIQASQPTARLSMSDLTIEQMKTEPQTAFTFSLVGKMRY